MHELALIIHFIGLAMGLGTSIAFIFLGIKSSKMNEQEKLNFQLDTLSLSRMGHLGLILLIASGLYLMTPYRHLLEVNPLLKVKLILVFILVILIYLINKAGKKALQKDPTIHFTKIKFLGQISLVTTLAIVILAVYIFH